ncbi:MAG: DUF2927 domain-containing protein [Thiomicrorhabdus sp.]|nr:DUF2927 domain-containing protein [Thiomicrorhabdus sp.]
MRIRTIFNPVLCLGVILLFATPTLASTQNTEQPWQDPVYIQKAFNEIALKNEYRATEGRILKWKKPIRYEFIYHNLPKNPLIERLFNTHLQHLQNITKHPIKQHKPHHSGKANLSIHLTSDQDYGQVIKSFSSNTIKDIERNSHCMANFKRNRQNAIIQAQVVLPVDHVFSKGLLVTCIVEETTQILGLPNDADWVNPSIANDATKVELLTGLDYLFLKILYDKSLTAGLPYPKNQKTIQRIIQKLNANGEIKGASQTINKMGLFPEIN